MAYFEIGMKREGQYVETAEEMANEYRRKQSIVKQNQATLMDQIDSAIAFLGRLELKGIASRAINVSWAHFDQSLTCHGRLEIHRAFVDQLQVYVRENPGKLTFEQWLSALKRTVAPYMTGSQLYDYEIHLLYSHGSGSTLTLPSCFIGFTEAYRKLLSDAAARRAAIPDEDDYLVAQELQYDLDREGSIDIV